MNGGMMGKSYSLCFLLLFVLLAICGFDEKPKCAEDLTLHRKVARDGESDIPGRVEALLRSMTIEEKIGQMTLFTSDWDITGPSLRSTYEEDIRTGRVGAIFNAYTAEFTRDLQKMAVEHTRLGIPLLFGYDVIHGMKTIFPIPLADSCSWDLDIIEQGARVAATEAAALGLHWTFAPMVDIARDPRWGRISEGAGEDPYLGQEIARARVRGFQGANPASLDSVYACVKHFAAYGAAEAGRDYNTTNVSYRDLHQIYLPPFKAAISEKAETVMTAFNDLDGVPCTANTWLITDILRNKWGFSGFVVTDYTSINEMVCHGIAADEKEAGELAVNAGVDMDMQGAVYYTYIPQLLKEGKVSMEQIDSAVRRILTLKLRKGLLDNPYRYSDPEREKEKVMNPEFLKIARDSGRKAIVLLKNEKSVLPLRKDIKTIGLIGPLADDKRSLIGSWSAAGDWKKAVSVREGILEKVSPGTKILYARGCDIEGSDRSGFQDALEVSKKSDVIVAVVGERWDMSGEAASRSDINLPGVQRELLMHIKKSGKPVIMVLMNGRPLTIPWEAENMESILETWFLGTEAGHSIADVLFGDYNPSGKLTVTFPRALGQVPIYYNAKNTGRPMDPKNKYTSKYLDIPNTPLFPFGYGLSYTTFEYSLPAPDRIMMGLRDTLTVTVTVKNTGKYDGEEVAQLYIRDCAGSVTRPVKELKGFRKIRIAKGESRTISFSITAKDLAFYRRDMSYGVEAGEFKVFVGPDSVNVKEASFTLTESGLVPE